MKIAREDLTRLTAACARIADSKHAVPAYRMTRLSGTEGVLTLAATDGEYWLTLHAPCDGDLPPILAPASRLAETVAKLTADTLDLAQEADSLIIKAKGSRRKMAVLPADSFPVPPVDEVEPIALDAARLIEGLAFCAPWASNDTTTQAYLCGVNLGNRDGRLFLAATDGQAVVEFDYGETPATLTATVPTGFVVEAGKFGLIGDVTLGIGERKVSLSWPEGELLAPRIEQAFADYRRIVPNSVPTGLTAPAGDIATAVAGVRGFGGDGGKFGAPIRIEATQGDVEFSAHSAEGEASDTLACNIVDDIPPVFGVSSAYLERAMRGFGNCEVTIGVTSATTPLLITSAALPDRLAVIMPRRI
jgi:DNA polymerase III sliding clamp (beta) subunit (PCNA family)